MNKQPLLQKTVDPMTIRNNTVPVVVLVSSQHGGIGIIRSLGKAGIPVYGVHQHPWEPSARSRYLQGVFYWNFSTTSSTDSVSFLLEIAKQFRELPVLIATSDITALFLAENAAQLAEGYLFSTPSAEVARSLSSKIQMADLCRKLKIPTAEIAIPHDRDDVLQFARLSGLPVIVKSECGDFRQGLRRYGRVSIAKSEKELLEIYDLNAKNGGPNLFLQAYIPGADDCTWMFNGYFNEQSECLFCATGKKLRQFPAYRGSTSIGVIEHNRVVVEQTLRLMRAVGYRGPLDIGYRFDSRDGQYKLLDVNPRIGATFRLFVAENELDVARAMYLDVTGQRIPPAEVRDGRKWIVETNDFISFLDYFRAGQLTPGKWVSSLRGIQEGVWFTAKDPAPLAMLPLLWFHKRVFRSATALSRPSLGTNQPRH